MEKRENKNEKEKIEIVLKYDKNKEKGSIEDVNSSQYIKSISNNNSVQNILNNSKSPGIKSSLNSNKISNKDMKKSNDEMISLRRVSTDKDKNINNY